MTSIPFDPRLVLGQVVPKDAIEDLKTIATLQKPQDIALKRYNNLASLQYKIKMMQNKLEGLEVSEKDMKKIAKKIEKHKKALVKASKDYVHTFIKSEKAINKFKTDCIKRDQKKEKENYAESPLDFTRCEVKTFPLSSNDLKFDVQYFRNETNFQGETAMTSSVTATVGAFVGPAKVDVSSSVSTAMSASAKNHKIEGTIVIMAKSTNKNADMITPFILDPQKAVALWNATYPKDTINVNDPMSLFLAATANPKDKPGIEILSGCSKAASFVGLVNILQKESTYSFDQSTQIEASLSYTMGAGAASLTGSVGASTAISTAFSTSFSEMQNTVYLVCNGYIPNIKTNDLVTTVESMKPSSRDAMSKLQRINCSSDAGMNTSMEGAVGEARNGEEFMQLESQNVSDAVSAMSEQCTVQVIDTNSMMDAFTDFVEKCQSGEGGVPTSFYTRKVTKADVCKSYIKRFFPNGATDPEAVKKGVLGIASDDK